MDLWFNQNRKFAMKIICVLMLAIHLCSFAWAQRHGLVTDEQGSPLSGVTIKLVPGTSVTTSNKNGVFLIAESTDADSLLVSHVGYVPQEVSMDDWIGNEFKIALIVTRQALEEVTISTGYYDQKKSEATGSFVVVDMTLYNKRETNDIIGRLEGLVPSLQFDRSQQLVDGQQAELRLRGVGSLRSNRAPLIIVDGFPYTEDVSMLNADDVAAITVLRDATAASIWGARSGNGVIVIETKKGRISKPVITVKASHTYGAKPDLFYNPHFLESASMMEVERRLFENNFYRAGNSTVIPRYVEYLSAFETGALGGRFMDSITNVLKQRDSRSQVSDNLYRGEMDRAYMLSISGGNEGQQYYVSANLNKKQAYLKGNDNTRVNLNSNYTLKISDRLGVNVLINYIFSDRADNGISIFDLNTNGRVLSPYAMLVDELGGPQALEKDYRYAFINEWNKSGKLNWSYRPMDEIQLQDHHMISNNMRSMAEINYQVIPGLRAKVKYLNQLSIAENRQVYDRDAYYVRNLVNQFTQPDGEQIIPYGGIFESGNSKNTTHSGRLQLDYGYSWSQGQLALLAGYEISHNQITTTAGTRIFDYNPENLLGITTFDYLSYYRTEPNGWTGLIPSPPGGMRERVNRMVSYYFNGSFNYQKKYLFSVSSRWDGSNIYGVDFNQKGVPLWSFGLNWRAFAESFYPKNLPNINLRFSYGISGNTNNSLSALPQIYQSMNSSTQLMRAVLLTAGNPDLRWEKVNTLNVGVDVASENGRIRGSFDFYRKYANDLLGENMFDPTSGIVSINGSTQISNLINYAALNTVGWDAEIHSRNLTSGLSWTSTLFVSHTRNRVKRYMANESSVVSYLHNGSAPVTIGESIDQIYKLPFFGLSAETGYPLTADGDDNYGGFLVDMSRDRLIKAGLSVPTVHGSMINTWNYQSLSLTVNISGKFGYAFQRSSISYGDLFNRGIGHADFHDRWMQPGDERVTNVPAMPNDVNSNRDLMYLESDRLMESGDHIRLEDVSLSYLYSPNSNRRSAFRSAELFINARRLGIIWAKNGRGLDPDVPYSTFPIPKSFLVGLNVKF